MVCANETVSCLENPFQAGTVLYKLTFIGTETEKFLCSFPLR